jgi:hypothetical protein
LVAKQMGGAGTAMTNGFFFFFTKSLTTINRCDCTYKTLSLPPPNGTVECQLYPPVFFFSPSSSHSCLDFFFLFGKRKEITKQLDAQNLGKQDPVLSCSSNQ